MTIQVQLGERVVGSSHAAYVIAEIGSNHDGSLAKACESVEAAAAAGADAVKFQSLRFDRIYEPSRTDSKFREEFRRIELSEDWYPSIRDAAATSGVAWFSSVTYLDAIDPLVRNGVAAMKIASPQFDLSPQIVEAAAATQLPLVMSTGLADVEAIDRTLRLARSSGAEEIVLLHCVSRYPADPAAINLKIMRSYESLFGLPVGYSDHTLGIEVVLAAVACGASMIEKHFTLDRSGTGPDHGFASESAEFRRMVEGIRTVESALGDGFARPLPDDLQALRESLKYKWVVGEQIEKGQPFRVEALELRRMPGGIEQAAGSVVVRATAARHLEPMTPLEWSDLRFPIEEPDNG